MKILKGTTARVQLRLACFGGGLVPALFFLARFGGLAATFAMLYSGLPRTRRTPMRFIALPFRFPILA
jgi:hypothetical protein